MITGLNQIKKWGYIFVLLFIFSSCSFEEVQFKEAVNFKLKKIEGRNLSISFDAILNNPNGYNLKVKPSTFDLHINGEHIGIVQLDEKIKIVKKSESTVAVPVTAEVLKGALPKLIAGALKKTATVRIVGTVKGAASGFPVRKKIDETREIPLRDLDFGLPF
jgi:LEA14-like dessication related protein